VPKGWRLAWRGKVPAGRMVEAAQLRRSKKKPRASAGLGSDSQDGCDQKPTSPMLVPPARMAGLFLFDLTTAKALGIDVPLSLMLRADEMLD